MSKRKHSPSFKAKVALEAVKADLDKRWPNWPPGTRSIPAQIQGMEEGIAGRSGQCPTGRSSGRSPMTPLSPGFTNRSATGSSGISWRRALHGRERRREMVDREHPALSTLRQSALMVSADRVLLPALLPQPAPGPPDRPRQPAIGTDQAIATPAASITRGCAGGVMDRAGRQPKQSGARSNYR